MSQMRVENKKIESKKMIGGMRKNLSGELSINMILMALISAVLFGNEVLLTRYFSTIMSVNLVYIVVSSAIFGTGIGAYITYNKLNQKEGISISCFISKKIVLLVLSVMLFWVVALIGPYIGHYWLYVIFSSTAYVFGGMIMSAIYLNQSAYSHKLYFTDMLGAVLGCTFVVVAMMYFQLYIGLSILFFELFMVLLLKPHSKNKSFKYILLTIVALIASSLFSNTVIGYINNNFDAYYMNPYKGIKYVAKSYKADVEIIYSNWGAFSRTDVLKLSNDDSVRYILTDGGATAPIIKFDGDLEKLQYMKSDVAYLPYMFGSNEKTLLIGSGGGKDVIYALLSESDDITAVEINEGTIAAVNALKDFSGDIYNQEGVNLIIGDGRKYVDETTENYDHIYLSMLMSNAVDNSRLSLVENYIFTEEAFASYMNTLNTDGRISFMVHNGIEAIRVVNTWIKTLIDSGIPENEVNDYFAIVNGMKNKGGRVSSISMPTVILKKAPFDSEELTSIKEFLMEEKVSAMHLPGNPNSLYEGLSDGRFSYEEMLNQFELNVKPVTDESPYFYKYSNKILIELSPLIILIAFAGLFFINKARRSQVSSFYSFHFIIIGMGYIILELGFIQLLQRYLEKPIFTFTVVIVGMLVGSAIGGLLSGQVNLFKKLGSYSTLITSVVSIGGYYLLSIIIPESMNLKIIEKIAMILPIILFVGFFMGMPFPNGVKRMSHNKNKIQQIPFMYALNGYASILGSVIALFVVMNFGYTVVILMGGLMYAILGIISIHFSFIE